MVGYHIRLEEDEPRVELSLERDLFVEDSRALQGDGDEASQYLLESLDEDGL